MLPSFRGNAILKMGFDAIVADVSTVGFTMVSKPTIVCMVLFDFDTMTGRTFFECGLLPALFLPMTKSHGNGDGADVRSGPQRLWQPCVICVPAVLLIG